MQSSDLWSGPNSNKLLQLDFKKKLGEENCMVRFHLICIQSDVTDNYETRTSHFLAKSWSIPISAANYLSMSQFFFSADARLAQYRGLKKHQFVQLYRLSHMALSWNLELRLNFKKEKDFFIKILPTRAEGRRAMVTFDRSNFVC